MSVNVRTQSLESVTSVLFEGQQIQFDGRSLKDVIPEVSMGTYRGEIVPYSSFVIEVLLRFTHAEVPSVDRCYYRKSWVKELLELSTWRTSRRVSWPSRLPSSRKSFQRGRRESWSACFATRRSSKVASSTRTLSPSWRYPSTPSLSRWTSAKAVSCASSSMTPSYRTSGRCSSRSHMTSQRASNTFTVRPLVSSIII